MRSSRAGAAGTRKSSRSSEWSCTRAADRPHTYSRNPIGRNRRPLGFWDGGRPTPSRGGPLSSASTAAELPATDTGFWAQDLHRLDTDLFRVDASMGPPDGPTGSWKGSGGFLDAETEELDASAESVD